MEIINILESFRTIRETYENFRNLLESYETLWNIMEHKKMEYFENLLDLMDRHLYLVPTGYKWVPET